MDELTKILENLPEEKKAEFMGRMKKEAELAVKTSDEEKKREFEKKCFKASGHWESENETCKMSADISEEDRTMITVKIEYKTEEENKREFVMTLNKEEFFNFFKMLADIEKSVKPAGEIDIFNETPWFDASERIRNLINSAKIFDDGWFHRRSLW